MKHSRLKQERVIEAVRHGLQGDAAVEFIHNSGYAMTNAGIARHLRSMGGRGLVQDRINEGMSNYDILAQIFPKDELEGIERPEPNQQELFLAEPGSKADSGEDPYEFTKITLKIPSDLYEAIKLAAHAENKSRSDLIIEILETTLSRMPQKTDDQG